MDFTIKKYEELIDALIAADYSFQTFSEFIKKPQKKNNHTATRRRFKAK